jgi:hypothetical protein
MTMRFVRLIQRVEGMEELFERGLFAAEELDVVDEQHVDLAVPAVEVGDLPLALVGGLQRLDEFVGEFLAGDVANLNRFVLDQRVVPDGVEQMRFAQPGAAVDT